AVDNRERAASSKCADTDWQAGLAGPLRLKAAGVSSAAGEQDAVSGAEKLLIDPGNTLPCLQRRQARIGVISGGADKIGRSSVSTKELRLGNDLFRLARALPPELEIRIAAALEIVDLNLVTLVCLQID